VNAVTEQELRELLLEVTGQLFRWTCELYDDGSVDWPTPEPDEAEPHVRDVGRRVESVLGVSWKKPSQEAQVPAE
jgi:hypothetical protein